MLKWSPAFIEWIYLEAFPLSYFLIRKWSSPGKSGRDVGVYGRMIGLPLASFNASGSGDFTKTQDATGSIEV